MGIEWHICDKWWYAKRCVLIETALLAEAIIVVRYSFPQFRLPFSMDGLQCLFLNGNIGNSRTFWIFRWNSTVKPPENAHSTGSGIKFVWIELEVLLFGGFTVCFVVVEPSGWEVCAPFKYWILIAVYYAVRQWQYKCKIALKYYIHIREYGLYNESFHKTDKIIPTNKSIKSSYTIAHTSTILYMEVTHHTFSNQLQQTYEFPMT